MKKMRVISSIIIGITMLLGLFYGEVHSAEASEEHKTPRDYVEINIDDFGTTSVQIYEGFDFLNKSSEELQWKLALNAAVLSKAMYDKKAGDILNKIGYDLICYPEGSEPKPMSPGITVAYKLIIDEEGRKKNVFAVVVKGTSTLNDKLTDAADVADMFESTELLTSKRVRDLISTMTNKSMDELKNEDNYFFFTGHSLGGAVANRLSVNTDIMQLAKNDKSRIYTYTFEPPHTCVDLWWMNVGGMSNAYNFIDVDDPIARLRACIGATTFGRNISFSVNDLSGGILKTLYPNTQYNSLRDYWNPISHHNIIGDLIYILQNGQLMDDYSEKKENVESRLAEVVSFVRTNETEPWIIDSKELYKYDDSGKLAERRAYSVDGNTIGKETFVYDSKGMIKQWEMTEYYTMEDTVTPRILVYYTDKDGKLTLSQSIEEYTGAIPFSPDIYLTGDDGDGLRISYDKEGRVSNIAKLYRDEETIYWDYDFAYDESGKINIYGYPWWHNPMQDENERDYGSRGWVNYVIQYDENGKLILLKEITEYAYNYKSYTYDDDDRLISVEEFSNTYDLDGIPGERLTRKKEFEYNEQGDLISEIIWDEYRYSFSLETNGTVSHQIDYYDNGQKRREIITETPFLSGTPSYQIYYDEDGRLAKYVIGTMSGLHLWTEIVYTYDASGKLTDEESTDFEYRYDEDWNNPDPEKEISEIRHRYYIYENYQ